MTKERIWYVSKKDLRKMLKDKNFTLERFINSIGESQYEYNEDIHVTIRRSD